MLNKIYSVRYNHETYSLYRVFFYVQKLILDKNLSKIRYRGLV